MMKKRRVVRMLVRSRKRREGERRRGGYLKPDRRELRVDTLPRLTDRPPARVVDARLAYERVELGDEREAYRVQKRLRQDKSGETSQARQVRGQQGKAGAASSKQQTAGSR